MYSSTLSLTSALDGGVSSQRHAPTALPPGKTRCPLYRRLGGPQGQSGRVRKISPPHGIRSPDRPACTQSLYLLSYRGILLRTLCYIKTPVTPTKYILQSVYSFYYSAPTCFGIVAIFREKYCML